MKACVVQPAYSYEYEQSDALFQWEMNMLDSCDESMDLIVFPEGTRSKDGELLEFKAGSFRIASTNGVPLVPLLIDGSRYTLEENGGWICPGRVTVRVFEPISTAEMGREELKALPQQLHDRLAEALAEQRKAN